MCDLEVGPARMPQRGRRVSRGDCRFALVKRNLQSIEGRGAEAVYARLPRIARMINAMTSSSPAMTAAIGKLP